jgi:heme oxygenase
MRPEPPLSLYLHLLGKFHGFYQPLEPILAGFSHWSALGLNLAQRRKTPWLLRDLSCLASTTADLPACPAVDWIHDAAAAMGTFYVLEGSTLGGQVIARHVATHLGLTPDHGLAFFSSYGESVGPRWKETREALLRFAEQSGEEDAMVDAAKKTFMALAAWLDIGPLMISTHPTTCAAMHKNND